MTDPAADVRIRLLHGVLQAELPAAALGDQADSVELWLDGARCAKAQPETAEGGGARVSFPLPGAAQRDGAVVLDMHLAATGAHLGRYTIFAGGSVPDDVVSELALLRAEMETLKQAFLRDAAEPKLRRADRGLMIADAVEAALAEQAPASTSGADSTGPG